MIPITVETQAFENEDFTLLGKITLLDGTLLQRSDFQTLELYVIQKGVATPLDTVTGTLPTATNPDGSSIFTDTLNTGNEWDVDSDGYNFRYQVRVQDFTTAMEGGNRYHFVFIFKSTTKGDIPAIFKHTALGVKSV